MSMLILKVSHTETCGVAPMNEATCTFDYQVRVGAGDINGNTGNIHVMLYEDGVKVWDNAISLDDLDANTKVETFNKTFRCNAQEGHVYSVRPITPATNLEVINIPLPPTYPFSQTLKLKCGPCTVPPGGGGGDN